jgi:hypothetical protein
MSETAVSRRALLAGVAWLPAVAGCSALQAGHAGPDPLLPLAQSAGNDAAAAAGIAREHPELAAASAIAKARRTQADALWREIGRAKISPTSGHAPARPPQMPPADRAAAKDRLTRDLSAAQRSAAHLLATLPSYRAGLAASVSAGCASLKELL